MECDDNVFLRRPEGYVRNTDVVRKAAELAARYMSLQEGDDYETCLEFVLRATAPGGQFEVKAKEMKVLRRKPNGDRERAIISVDQLLKGVQKTGSILTPNLVVYDNPTVNRSITATYTLGKATLRGKVKKTGQNAYQVKNMDLYLFCHNQEYVIKIFINSISGAHVSPHNPLYNKTGHSSLTSNCRILTSYSNASTERFISGNRHYYSKEVVIENILSTVHHTDYAVLEKVVNKYNLHYPTPFEVMKMIKRCTMFYWDNKIWFDEILELVEKLTPLQRVAYVYTGDLYHLALYNDGVVRELMDSFVNAPIPEVLDDPDRIVTGARPDVVALVGILCQDILAGTTPAELKVNNPGEYLRYAMTMQHVGNMINLYADLFTTLFVNDCAPASVYEFPHSIRRAVIGSDTDSTMFTAQDWVEWYCGKLEFTPVADRVGAVTCFMNTQMIAHWLAAASRQMGVEDANLYQLQMKNEYEFKIYMRANRAKHYATMMTAREGAVFEKPKIDIKGVGLLNSKIPKSIMGRLEDEIENVMYGIRAGLGIDILPLMQRIANLEHQVEMSLQLGSIEYLSTGTINPPHTYKQPMSSVYVHYDMWVNVFEQKWGVIETPPYTAVKISTTLDNKHRLKAWVSKLDDVTREAMENWLAKLEKEEIGTLWLPAGLFESQLPAEIVEIMNRRTIIAEQLSGYYILLEMCGFYIKNKNNTMLLYDFLSYSPDFKLPGEVSMLDKLKGYLP